MKNICFICYDLSIMGGAEKVATDVANALCDHYKVHMVSLWGDVPILPLDSRIAHTNLGLDLSRLRKGIIPATKALKSFYKQNAIDVSFIIGNYAGMVCSFTSLFTGTKQVLCDHGALMNQWDKKDVRTIRHIASKLCDYTLVLTEQSCKDYIERFHLSPNQVVYIHNWIEAMPCDISYNIDSKIILSAGRFGKEKGFHSVLPQVAAKVYFKHKDWQWHIYGDGEYFDQTSEQISALGLENFLILKGRANNLGEIYSASAMYALTSDREGMPLVLLEAKASGLPIVSFDVQTGPREIVRQGVDGYLIPPNDADSMAESICTLIEDADLRRRFSHEAKSDAPRFSKEKLLGHWIDFIERT